MYNSGNKKLTAEFDFVNSYRFGGCPFSSLGAHVSGGTRFLGGGLFLHSSERELLLGSHGDCNQSQDDEYRLHSALGQRLAG